MTRQELNCQLQQIAATASRMMSSKSRTYRAAQARYLKEQIAQLEQ